MSEKTAVTSSEFPDVEFRVGGNSLGFGITQENDFVVVDKVQARALRDALTEFLGEAA